MPPKKLPTQKSGEDFLDMFNRKSSEARGSAELLIAACSNRSSAERVAAARSASPPQRSEKAAKKSRASSTAKSRDNWSGGKHGGDFETAVKKKSRDDRSRSRKDEARSDSPPQRSEKAAKKKSHDDRSRSGEALRSEKAAKKKSRDDRSRSGKGTARSASLPQRSETAAKKKSSDDRRRSASLPQRSETAAKKSRASSTEKSRDDWSSGKHGGDFLDVFNTLSSEARGDRSSAKRAAAHSASPQRSEKVAKSIGASSTVKSRGKLSAVSDARAAHLSRIKNWQDKKKTEEDIGIVEPRRPRKADTKAAPANGGMAMPIRKPTGVELKRERLKKKMVERAEEATDADFLEALANATGTQVPLVPMLEEYVMTRDITDNDVCVQLKKGGGKFRRSFEPPQEYSTAVNFYATKWKHVGQTRHVLIKSYAFNIIRLIRSRGGRFLHPSADSGVLGEVGDIIAMKKVATDIQEQSEKIADLKAEDEDDSYFSPTNALIPPGQKKEAYDVEGTPCGRGSVCEDSDDEFSDDEFDATKKHVKQWREDNVEYLGDSDDDTDDDTFKEGTRKHLMKKYSKKAEGNDLTQTSAPTKEQQDASLLDSSAAEVAGAFARMGMIKKEDRSSFSSKLSEGLSRQSMHYGKIWKMTMQTTHGEVDKFMEAFNAGVADATAAAEEENSNCFYVGILENSGHVHKDVHHRTRNEDGTIEFETLHTWKKSGKNPPYTFAAYSRHQNCSRCANHEWEKRVYSTCTEEEKKKFTEIGIYCAPVAANDAMLEDEPGKKLDITGKTPWLPKWASRAEVKPTCENCLPIRLTEEFNERFNATRNTHEMHRMVVDNSGPPTACGNCGRGMKRGKYYLDKYKCSGMQCNIKDSCSDCYWNIHFIPKLEKGD